MGNLFKGTHKRITVEGIFAWRSGQTFHIMWWWPVIQNIYKVFFCYFCLGNPTFDAKGVLTFSTMHYYM